jgi:hypothetical protein
MKLCEAEKRSPPEHLALELTQLLFNTAWAEIRPSNIPESVLSQSLEKQELLILDTDMRNDQKGCLATLFSAPYPTNWAFSSKGHARP